MSAEEPTIFAALFNFSFEKLGAKQIVKTGYTMYVVAVAVITLGVVGFVTKAALDRPTFHPEDMGPAIIAPFGALLALILGRLFFELVIVLFAIVDELRAQRHR